MCTTCPQKFDHDAFPAARFIASKSLLPDDPTSSSPLTRNASGCVIRVRIRANIPALTSALTRAAISFKVENPGSSSDSRTSTSNATLIRSGG